MSDEEKKAIDLLKNIDKQKCIMLECPVVKNNIERQLKIIELNRTIRKQSKEIEEAKQKEKKAYIDGTNDAHELCNKNWEAKIKTKIEVLEKLEKEIKELKKYEEGYKLLSYSLENYINKDKIKAKIEELQEDIKYSANPLSIDNSKFGIKVLQSLLDKE